VPELPEVECVARALRKLIIGRTVERITVRQRSLRRPVPRRLASALKRATIDSIDRRGKYMVWRTGGRDSVLVHLGMSGRFRINPTDKSPHDHVVFRFAGGPVLCFNDARRFGVIDLVPADEPESHPLLANLGVEPLSDSFTPKLLRELLAGRRAPIKNALMDQRLIAGLGNIYANEALYCARIAPTRPASSLSAPETKTLVRTIRAVLEQSIADGGSTLRDHALPDGELGLYQTRFRVYGRGGKRCQRRSCPGHIERTVQSARATFFCPDCQR